MSAVINDALQKDYCPTKENVIIDADTNVVVNVKDTDVQCVKAEAAMVEAKVISLEAAERHGWSSKFEFLLAVVGFAVGLGNIWRFPYLCQKHGRGAFLIPYFLCMVILAIPLFYLELALGQRFRKGPLHLWSKLCKPLSGIGIGSLICSWLITVYYQMIVGWCFYYFCISFYSNLPYATCPCIGGLLCNATNPQYLPECVRATPTTYYWYRHTLDITSSIEVSGNFNWKLFLCLIMAWIVVFAINWKGIVVMGKVVYFTTLFPYLVLTIFFVRSLTLDGAGDGIRHMFTPEWSRLYKPETWLAAFSQVFLSLGLAQGSIIAYASYNEIHNNIRNDAFLISAINSGTSIFAGVTTFGILGYKAKKKFMSHCPGGENSMNVWGMNETNCDMSSFLNDVAQGPGLTFIAFTEAMSTMKFPQVWSVLFFVMILALGVGTNVGQIEPIRTTLCDTKSLPFRSEVRTLIMCLFSCCVGIVFCQGSGEYWLQMFDAYCANFGLLTIAFFEIVVAVYVYGLDNIKKDIKYMVGETPGLYWTICWRFHGPLLIAAILLATVYQLCVSGIPYMAYDEKSGLRVPARYPAWGQALCYMLIIASVMFIPLVAILVRLGYFNFSKTARAAGSVSHSQSTQIIVNKELCMGEVNSVEIVD